MNAEPGARAPCARFPATAGLPPELAAELALELAAVHARCFTRPPPWPAAGFASFLADPRCFLVAGSDGAGFALGRVIADEAELLTLAVVPESRRRGRGRALLAGFVAEAARRGAARAFLEVAEANAEARRLYRAAGFAATGRRRAYFGPSADAVVMACDLAAQHRAPNQK